MKMISYYSVALFFSLTMFVHTVWAQNSIEEITSLIDREQFTRADQLLDERISIDAKDPENYYWKGIVQYKMENFPAARTAFEKGIKVKNKNPYNHAGLGMALFRIGKKKEAVESLRKALDVGRKDVGIHFAVATAFLEEGSPKSLKEAEILLMQAQEKIPDDARSYIALGDYYFAKDIPELALIQYQKAVEIAPDYAEAHARVGQIYITKGQYQDGALMLDEAIKIDPDYAPAYKHMGELWLKAQDFEKARDNYKKYVELTGNDFYAKQRYASFLFLTEEYQGALDVLESLDTTTNLGWRLKGMVYLELGDAAQSKKCMATYFSRMQAIYTIPTDYMTLGKAHYESGEDEKAQENFEKAYDMDRAQVEVWKEISDQCKKKKQHAREVRFRKIYIEKKEKASIRDYYFLGEAQYRAKQFAGADSSFAMVIDMKEDFTAAHYYRVRIAQKLDPENEQWLTVPHSQKIVQYLGSKEMGDLKAREKRQLKDCYLILTFHAFNQQPNNTGDCEAASAYLDKALTFNPEMPDLIALRKYCEGN